MELADEFRSRAQRCLKLAQDAPTLEAQAHWLGMAQLWLNLAQHAEQQDAQFLSGSVPADNGKNGDENGHSNEDPQPES